MELFLLLTFAILLNGVKSCVKVDEDSLACQGRWNGAPTGDIDEVRVYGWDGSCLFPAGVTLKLFGTVASCQTCPKFDDTVTVNGFACSNKRAFQSASSTTDMSSHTVKMQTTESKHVTVEIRKHTTTPALDASSVQPWSYGLLGALGVTVLLMTLVLAWFCIRSRRRRAYCCIKPRTSPNTSLDSIVIYPTLQL